MNYTTLIDSSRKYSGVESRRSSRIEYPVAIMITGQDGFGQEFMERTAPVSLNLHGCRYPSRHDCHVGSWITLQIGETALGEEIRTIRAQVKSVHLPRSVRELYHVGVELEAPSNVWNIPSPPEDWLRTVGSETTTTSSAATGPAHAPRMIDMPLPPRSAEQPQLVPQAENGSATEVEASNAAKTAPVIQMPQPGEPVRPPRVVVTPEQLVSAVQGKLQQAAETAVKNALAQHLAPALAKALTSIEEARESAIQKVTEMSSQHKSSLVHTSREEVLARLEDRLDEARSRWDSQMDGFRIRAEEIVQRVDRQSSQARNDLTHARETAENAVKGMDTQLSAMLAESLAQASEEFDRYAAQTTERQIARLSENAQTVMRETLSHLQANVSEARATVHTTAREALEEFQRQSDVHCGLSMQDTVQRVTTTLAALEAQHRSACDERRQAIESDVRRTGDQLTEQFRSSLRAFFYSCLVAAVGAVEEHSKTTGEGFSLDPKKLIPPQS